MQEQAGDAEGLSAARKQVVQQGQHQLLQPQQQHEVQVLSLERASLGQVLARAPVTAAHCLTSVQFSPTSHLLLLAYGRCVFAVCSLCCLR